MKRKLLPKRPRLVLGTFLALAATIASACSTSRSGSGAGASMTVAPATSASRAGSTAGTSSLPSPSPTPAPTRAPVAASGPAPAASPTPGPSPAPVATPVDERLGISVPGFPRGSDAASVARRKLDLDEIVAAGFHVVRTDFPWTEVEPARGSWNWDGLDRVVDDLRAHGLEVLGMLGYGNTWARPSGPAAGDPFAPPADPADFAAYVAATVAHFKGRVSRFEIWNEPNAGVRFWQPLPGGDPTGYAKLLQAAYAAGKQANAQAQISFAGTFYQPVPGIMPGTLDFGESAYRSGPGLGASFDAFAFHPYRYPFLAPEAKSPLQLPGEEPFGQTIENVRALLARHGDAAKPLWITEEGWHTAPWSLPFVGVPEVDQARDLVRAALDAFARDVALFFVYTLRDGPNNQTWQEDAFGILHYSPDPVQVPAQPKPARDALRTLSTVLAGATFDADASAALGLPAEARALRFVVSGTPVYALWTYEALVPQPVAHVGVPAGASSAEVVGLDGAVRSVAASSGAVDVTLGESPLFVRFR